MSSMTSGLDNYKCIPFEETIDENTRIKIIKALVPGLEGQVVYDKLNDPDSLILIPEDKTPWKQEEPKCETKEEKTEEPKAPYRRKASPRILQTEQAVLAATTAEDFFRKEEQKEEQPKKEDLPHYIPLKPLEEPKKPAPLSKNQKKKLKKKLNKAAEPKKKLEPKKDESSSESESEPEEEVKAKPKSKAKGKVEAKKATPKKKNNKAAKKEDDGDEDDMHETEMSSVQDDLRDSLDFIRENLSGSSTKFFKAMGEEIDYWTEERRMSNGRWVAVLRFEWQSYFVSLASIEEKLLPTAKLHTYEAMHSFFRHMVQKRAFSEFGEKLSYFVIRKTPEIIDMFAGDNNVGTADYAGSSESESGSEDEGDDEDE